MQKTTKTSAKTSKTAQKVPKTNKKTTKTTQKRANSEPSTVKVHQEIPKSKLRNSAGRPPRMTTKKLIAAAYEYMNTAEVPNITEFALQQGYERSYLYQRAEIELQKGKPELSNTIKMISQMKEIQLEKMAICGLCPPNFAIFALKQLGWSDKVEQKIDADVEENVNGVLVLAPVLEEE